MADDDTILVRALKNDGSEHRRWTAQVVQQEGPLIVLDAKFDRKIEHNLLGTISQGTLSVEYYWLDRWYNIFRFIGPGGVLKNFYCNVNKPPSFDGQILSYIDLDIDVLVEADFSFTVLDLDEFERNAIRYDYPLEIQVNARRAVNDLIGLIQTRDFPFDH